MNLSSQVSVTIVLCTKKQATDLFALGSLCREQSSMQCSVCDVQQPHIALQRSLCFHVQQPQFSSVNQQTFFSSILCFYTHWIIPPPKNLRNACGGMHNKNCILYPRTWVDEINFVVLYTSWMMRLTRCYTRNSSADEIANVNFLRRHRTRNRKYKKRKNNKELSSR